jgi:hypothetical protein
LQPVLLPRAESLYGVIFFDIFKFFTNIIQSILKCNLVLK